jgi:hypothetical protein
MPPYVFMAWYLVNHRETFTFNLHVPMYIYIYILITCYDVISII